MTDFLFDAVFGLAFLSVPVMASIWLATKVFGRESVVKTLTTVAGVVDGWIMSFLDRSGAAISAFCRGGSRFELEMHDLESMVDYLNEQVDRLREQVADLRLADADTRSTVAEFAEMEAEAY